MSARGKMGKAVENGVPRYTSVSALNSFEGCARQWWLHYVEGLPGKPETASQKIGTEGHGRLEHFLRTGQDVLGPLERRALEWMPRPGLDLLIEHPIHTEGGPRIDAAGIPIVGFVDLVDARDPRAIKIVDWKFRGDVERYGSRAADLGSVSTDAGRQMLTYAAWARKAFPKAQAVELSHGQFQFKGRQTFTPVSERIDLDLAAKRWSEWALDVGPRLKAVAKERSYLRVLPNYQTCSKYGGCAYQSICHNPAERLAAALFPGEKDMGMIKNASPAVPVPAVPSTAVPESSSSPPEVLYKRPIAASVAPVGILPPDAPASKPELASKPLEVKAPPEVSPVPEPKKRTKKDVTRPPAETVPVADGFERGIADGVESGIHLYFGCSPLGVPTKSLLEFTLACEKLLIEQAQIKVPDIRVVTTVELGFGKWKAYLAGVAKEAVTAEKSDIRLSPGHYLVMDGDDRIECVAEALTHVLPAGCVVVA